VLETKPDYDTWKTYAVASFSDLSSMDLVQSSFGLIDLVFIFLGVGTAYRLGFTGRQSPAA
jgi:hypothetical protein